MESDLEQSGRKLEEARAAKKQDIAPDEKLYLLLANSCFENRVGSYKYKVRGWGSLLPDPHAPTPTPVTPSHAPPPVYLLLPLTSSGVPLCAQCLRSSLPRILHLPPPLPRSHEPPACT